MTELTALERGTQALKDLQAKGEKITLYAVATRGDFNHSNLYKKTESWVSLRENIETAMREWAKSKLKFDVKELQSQNASLKNQLAKAKALNKELKGPARQNRVSELLAEMTELYRINDKLSAENYELKNQLLTQIDDSAKYIRVDKETGEETIVGLFNKK